MVWQGSALLSRCGNDTTMAKSDCKVFGSDNGETAEFVLLDLLSCLLTA